METNEIKKALYKQNPIANMISVTKDGLHYATTIENEVSSYDVYFRVPLDDIGTGRFDPHMDAKYLIRWIIGISDL